ncbi:MAG: family 78 glycoside hydrolase catalytic domain [Fimbriimonadaceae bacterium]
MALVPTRLRCNLLVEPLAVAEGRPRLSWVLQGDSRSQSAYQIVAETEAGDGLWDSGRIGSDATCDVVYEGKAPAPRQRVRWRVRAWDEKGAQGDWSEWAHWTAAPGAWEAEWIGFDEPLDASRPPDFIGASWVWHADGPLDPVPVSTARFRKSFTLAELPGEATMLVTGDDSFHAYVNGTDVGKSDGNRDSWRRPGLLDVKSALKRGENTIEIVVGSIGVSASALIAKLETVQGGSRTSLVTDATWEARWEESSDWKPVRVVGGFGAPPWGSVSAPGLFLPPPRVLTRPFDARSPVRRAVLYATALGIYEASVNGQRVGEDWFAPGWTDYKKRVHYRAYDVTSLVKSGSNTIETLLCDGWFAGYVGFGRRHHYGEETRFSAMLWLDYEDSPSQLVATDENWRAATGATTQSDFLMGEEHDARRSPGDWHPVVMGKEVSPVLEPYPMEPLVAFEEVQAKTATRAPNGTHVYDLGQNFAGVPRLDLSGQKAGTEIVLRHAEVLNTDGSAYTTNLRSARARDAYTTREGDQEWSPRGTFHGFRYVESSVELPRGAVSGLALSNVAKPASGFECSDARLNQLWSNIDWTFRSNFIEIPTDCPQRDERLGWTGDIQVFARAAMILADVQSFLDKWLVDLADAQRDDGQFPMIAPVVYGFSDGGPAWADAGTIVPWAMWEAYGDRRVLERQYASMKKFVAFCSGRLVDGLPPKEFHCFGDWLNVGVETPTPVLYMLFLCRSTWIVSQTAAVLGKNDEADRYASDFKRHCMRFRARFMGDDGWIEGKSQTGQAMALAFDVVDDPSRSKVFARLVEDIESRGHLTTGFVGTKDLMLVLRDGHRTDLAYKLLLSDEYPGWLFSIKHGATSIWERWNGWTPESGFADPGMNSFAHYAFGAVGQFMMETIGGIRPLEPGYKRVMIHVERGPLEWANCWFDSPRGRIATSWKGRTLVVTVPPNVEADVRMVEDDITVGAGTHEFSF